MNPTQTDNVVEQRSGQRCAANHIFSPRTVRNCARTAQTSPSKTQEQRRHRQTHASAKSTLPHQLKPFPHTLSWSPGALPSRSSISLQ
ncbi:hypothetical protein BC826DRAFT_1070310 [Russula brevipes]|nr:hypothetical protein BC826DRAFT_1070310 [Russula brevipes]